MLALLNITVESTVWFVAAVICLGGALGVVGSRNPVHSALSLVATLFGVAVMFIIQQAYFLAAIQVIVYAGAIVVLFLFVIMLLGVDRVEALADESNLRAWPVVSVVGAALAVLVGVAALAGGATVTGAKTVTGPLTGDTNINQLGKFLFTRYVFEFEITAVLLTIAVVGAVVLVRKPTGEPVDLDEFPEPEQAPDDLAEVE